MEDMDYGVCVLCSK